MKTNKKENKMNANEIRDVYMSKVNMNELFWKLTYSDGNVEYTEKAPYAKGESTEYERLVSVNNPVIKFELVMASNKNNDLRIVPLTKMRVIE